MPAVSQNKTQARMRKHNMQVAELNATRKELHDGNWDGYV
jgi:tRNA (adenine-N(1)-)-methyltransferase non-catalytic subunit